MTEPSAIDTAPPAPPTASRRSRVGMPVYCALLVAACAGIVLADPPTREVLVQGLLWMPLIAAGQMTRVVILPRIEFDRSLASLVIVAAAVLLPPSAVVLFTAVGLLSPLELKRQAPLVMALFNRAQHALSGAAAAVAAAAVVGDGSAPRLVLAVLLASIAFAVANGVFPVVALVLRRGLTWRRAVEDVADPFPRFAVNAGVSSTLSALLVVLVRDVGWWSVLLLVAPLWLSHSAQQSARAAQDRAEQLALRVRQLETLNRLSDRLLRVHGRDDVPRIAASALTGALGTDVEIDLHGTRDAATPTVVPLTGAEPAVLLVSGDIDDDDRAMVEASAALVGLTLTRLAVEAELAENERARTALTGRILEEATHERSRIALAVHDDVLPLFAAAQMKIDTLEMVLETHPDRASEMIDDAMAAVTHGIAELRDTLESLRRSTLVPGTLREGVAKLLADLQARTGVRTALEAPERLPDLPFAVELLAFETIRGGLANVEKHAGASTLHVELDGGEGRLVLVMQDNGRGFDPAKVGRRSHGLALMRQRAELARGRFEVTGAPGAGTTMRLEVPTW